MNRNYIKNTIIFLLALLTTNFYSTSLAQTNPQPSFHIKFDFTDPFWGNSDTLKNIKSVRARPTSFDPQKIQNWCWAAVSATIIDSITGKDVNPCSIASANLSKPCCSNPNQCNQQNSMQALKQIYNHFDIDPEYIDGRVNVKNIMESLDDGYPVTVRIESKLGNGHFVNIVGYDLMENMGERRLYVMVHDPMYGYYHGDPSDMGYSIDYRDFKAGIMINYYSKWTHTVLYYDK